MENIYLVLISALYVLLFALLTAMNKRKRIQMRTWMQGPWLLKGKNQKT